MIPTKLRIGANIRIGVILFVSFAILQLSTSAALAQGSMPTEPNFKVAFIGDSGADQNFKDVLNLIKAEGAQLVLHQGDFAYSAPISDWSSAIDSILGPSFPYFASDGNHDNWNDYMPFFKRRLSAAGLDPNLLNSDSYSIVFKGLKMVFSKEFGNPTYIQQQLANDNHIWKVCSWHRNMTMMQVGSKTNDQGWGDYEECRRAGAIIATAHEHTYHRTKTLLSTQNLTVDTVQHPLVGGVPSNPNSVLVGPGKSFVFVSGLGGNSIRNQDRCLPVSYPYGGGAGCKYIWANVYTSDQNAKYGALFITFNVDGNPNRARGYFKDISGKIIDQFEITNSSTSVIGQPTPTPTTPGQNTPTPTRTSTPGFPTNTPGPTSTPRPIGGPACLFWRGLDTGLTPTIVVTDPPTIFPLPTQIVVTDPPTIFPLPTPTGFLNPTSTPTPTLVGPTSTPPPPPPPGAGIWISQEEIARLPSSGAAWSNMKSFADSSTITPDVNNQDSNANVQVLARALVYAKTGDSKYLNLVLQGLRNVIGTDGSNDLGLSRELGAYVISADLINLKQADTGLDGSFRNWLRKVLPTLKAVHERRPNNWGTNAGGSRIAAALYLGDQTEVNRAAQVFKGWLGDRSSYSGFTWGDLSWQCNSNTPVGINPVGCTKQGHSIDGVLPDDQRRCGSFTWPPCATDYSWGGMMGAAMQAELLYRAGYDTWNWSDKALLRAAQWLYAVGQPATGDKEWIAWVINKRYGSNLNAPSPVGAGKNMAWTDWTHAR